MLRAAIVAMLLFAVSATPAAADAWWPLHVAPSGAIVVQVRIGGEGPFAFLLDTGSSRSAISTTLADRLGARPVGETAVLTPSGRVTRSLTPLLRLSIDGGTLASALAMIVPDADLTRDVRADGIIGQDVLARLVVTIDYTRERLMWGHRPHAAGEITLPVAIEDGRLVVSLPQRSCRDIEQSGCGPLQLIPDTGADGVVLFARPGGSLPTVTPLGTAAVRTLAGTRVVRRVLIDAVELSDFHLHGQIASLVEQPTAAGLSVDGLLPLHFFARVTLDGPGRLLTFVPR